MAEDPELAEALYRAAGEISARSRVSLLRELAIIGAGKVAGDRPDTTLKFLLTIPGTKGPSAGEGDLEEFFRKHLLTPPWKVTPTPSRGWSMNGARIE